MGSKAEYEAEKARRKTEPQSNNLPPFNESLKGHVQRPPNDAELAALFVRFVEAQERQAAALELLAERLGARP